MKSTEFKKLTVDFEHFKRGGLPDLGNLLTVAGTTSITAVVTNMMADTVGSTITVPVSGSVFDTLQLNAWTTDAIGYNLSISLVGSNFPASLTTYQVVVTINPVAGSPSKLVWQLQTDDVL